MHEHPRMDSQRTCGMLAPEVTQEGDKHAVNVIITTYRCVGPVVASSLRTSEHPLKLATGEPATAL